MLTSVKRKGLILTILASIFFQSGHTQTRGAQMARNTEPPSIVVTLSLIWEGESLKPENIRAIENFRTAYAGINLMQFFNPAYFTKPDTDTNRVASVLRKTLRPGDRQGLHLHGWRSLVIASGVLYRDTPTFWAHTAVPCTLDCGHPVPISTYRTDELQRIIRHSISVMTKHGFDHPKDFLAGGWMASENVLSALIAEGFERDYSAVPPKLVFPRLRQYPLFHWLNGLWHNILPVSQPFKVTTDTGTIMQMTNNAGTIDYQSVDAATKLFSVLADMVNKGSQKEPLFYNIGFYQETAARQLPRIEQLLQNIFRISTRQGISVRFTSSSQNTQNYSSQKSCTHHCMAHLDSILNGR